MPIFDRHRVDIVSRGTTMPICGPTRCGANSPVKAGEGGTVYVVSVSGQKFVPLADRGYTARGFADVATYQTVDISPSRGTLLYRALDVQRPRGRPSGDQKAAAAYPVAGRARPDPAIRRSAAP